MKSIVVPAESATLEESDKGIHWGSVHCPFCDAICHVYGDLQGELYFNELHCEHERDIVLTSGYEIIILFKGSI